MIRPTISTLVSVSTVLFVEDNHDDFELISRQVRRYKESALVMEYSDSLASALRRLKLGGIDIILLDLSLPDSQGLDTVKRIRSFAPAVPIVVLTGNADNDVALAALKYGVEDYLVKGSFDAVALCRSVNYALARNSAREAREKLAIIVDASDDAIIGKTLNGTITSWNKGASKLFGYSADEATGQSVSMLFPPESSTELAGILKAISNGETIQNRETVRICKNGQRIDISATISPIVQSDGTVTGAAAIDRDLTERNKTQRVLMESEERFRMVVAGVKDYAIFTLDTQGLVTSWNDGAKQIKGYEPAEIIGKHFSVFYSPSDQRLGIPASCLETALQRGSFEGLGWRQRKDGSSFFADVVVTPSFDADGTLRGFTKITRDISERRLAEQEIEDANLRLGLALESAAIGVWDFDLAKNTVWRSLRHDEIFGYHELLPEWNFDTFATHVVPEDLEVAREAFKAALERGNFSMQVRITRADNNAIRWISARGTTFRNKEGVVIRMMGTVADITDIADKQEQKRLLSIMKEREDFMATLTHDMKNPLIGANRLLELFVAGSFGELTSAQLEMLHCLKQGNSGLLKLIEDLIDVYRLEKDVNSLFIEDCDLLRIIVAQTSHITPLAKLRSIKVITEFPERLMLQGDASRLERVVQNLLDNAVKFAPEDGTIKVRLFSTGDNAVIEVEDNGPGIPPEEHSVLFKRFSQGNAGKRHAGGSGLGLYLCKQVVEAHGGTIGVDSQGNGSTIFRITLPQSDAKEVVTSDD